MAGGESTRLWPLSRRRTPKQFLRLAKGRTLLQATAARMRRLVPWEQMLVVTAAAYADEVRRQLPRVLRRHILVEPMGRNTAACIVLAAEWLAAHVGPALMVIVPADHAVSDTAAATRTLRTACVLAGERDCLVTIGIAATAPETGYGYIEKGAVIAGAPGLHWVRRFHEKPSYAQARRYAASGRHLWNAGIFVWKTDVLRSALRRLAPELERALSGVWRSESDSARRLRRAYRQLPSRSIDVALLQPATVLAARSPRVAVVPASFGWLDVGTWSALHTLRGGDADGNTAVGKLLALDARGCVVYAPDHLVALLGVDDLIVAEHDGALLICPRGRAQDVRRIVAELQRRRWTEYL
jgi:mannose-1-phosphate guanylyltransferase